MKLLLECVDRQSLKDREIMELRSKLAHAEKSLVNRDNELQLVT
jgi:hypothetical protein